MMNDALLDEQEPEGGLIYVRAAALSARCLYSNGNLRGANVGDLMK